MRTLSRSPSHSHIQSDLHTQRTSPLHSPSFFLLTSCLLDQSFFFFFLMIRRPPNSPLFPYTPFFRSPPLHNVLSPPLFTIGFGEPFGRRLRRNYLWFSLLLARSWTLKVFFHPVPADTFQLFLQRAT